VLFDWEIIRDAGYYFVYLKARSDRGIRQPHRDRERCLFWEAEIPIDDCGIQNHFKKDQIFKGGDIK
jgi:hypothetical protein